MQKKKKNSPLVPFLCQTIDGMKSAKRAQNQQDVLKSLRTDRLGCKLNILPHYIAWHFLIYPRNKKNTSTAIKILRFNIRSLPLLLCFDTWYRKMLAIEHLKWQAFSLIIIFVRQVFYALLYSGLWKQLSEKRYGVQCSRQHKPLLTLLTLCTAGGPCQV